MVKNLLTTKIKLDIINKTLSEIGRLAQLGEHRLYTAGVIGPSPITSTMCQQKNWKNSEVAKRDGL